MLMKNQQQIDMNLWGPRKT